VVHFFVDERTNTIIVEESQPESSEEVRSLVPSRVSTTQELIKIGDGEDLVRSHIKCRSFCCFPQKH
jgi:hypothetical protein